MKITWNVDFSKNRTISSKEAMDLIFDSYNSLVENVRPSSINMPTYALMSVFVDELRDRGLPVNVA